VPDLRASGRTLLIVSGLATAGIALVRRGTRAGRPGSPYFAGSPLLMAHRGGSALAPENTLVAFQRAVDWWHADVLELDVQPTRDGEAVVFHDATLDRTTDAAGPIADRSYQELVQVDAGYRFSPDGGRSFPFRGGGVSIPSLAEVLAACPDVRVNIEIKNGKAQERVWETIREAGAVDRVLIAAGVTKNRRRLSGYPVPVSAGKEDLRTFIGQLRMGKVLITPDVDAFQIPLEWEGRQVLSRELIAEAHRLNIAVHVWTVDDLSEMNRLLDWNVDGIITDRPDRLARLLHVRNGRPLPPGPPNPVPQAFLEDVLRE